MQTNVHVLTPRPNGIMKKNHKICFLVLLVQKPFTFNWESSAENDCKDFRHKQIISVCVAFHFNFYILDQLWSYDPDTMQLINKAGIWRYMEDKFTIPLENTEGAIELQDPRKSRKKVFGLKGLKTGPRAFGYKVKLLKRGKPTGDEQIWLRSPVENNWFTLKNKATGRFLTKRDDKYTPLVVAGTSLSI